MEEYSVPQELEVSCEENPTQLFLLMNRQLWDSALAHLHRHPIQARVWIGSQFSDEVGGGYKWRNLPLHLACLHGPEPVPLHFMEVLIETYPDAAQYRNHEGNLPIHMACECMDLGPRFGIEAEGILITLIKAFPECLGERDSMGRRPIDIFQEKGAMASSSERRKVGRGVGIIKYMVAQARSMESGETIDTSSPEDEKHQESDEYEPSGREPGIRSRPKNIELHYSDMNEQMESSETGRALYSKSYARGGIRSDPAHSVVEKSFHFSPQNKVLHNDTTQDDQIIRPRLMRRNNLSSRSPYDPMHLGTLHGTDETPPPKCLEPFQHSHQSMSHAHARSEDELHERLQKLEAENAQLKNDFRGLANQHSRNVVELEEKTKALEHCHYEIETLKLKAKEDKVVDLTALRKELERERSLRIAAKEKLEHQKRMCANLKETSRENSKLSMENEYLREQLENKSKELREMTEKEKTMLELMSKMQSSEGDENKDLQKQFAQMKDQLQEVRARESKARRECQRMTTENKQLHRLLSQRSQRLQVPTQTTEELQQKAFHGGAKCGDSETQEMMQEKNMVLREVALRAIDTVGILQQMTRQMPSPHRCSKQNLEQLLKDAELTREGESSSRSCVMTNAESLQLLLPVIDDARNLQKDTVARIQQLLQQSQDTMTLIDHIPSIPHENLTFESTLGALEDIMTTHVTALETLGSIWDKQDECKSKLICVLNQQMPGEISRILASNDDDNETEPRQRAKDDSALLLSLRKHVEKLETISRIVSGFPRVKLDSDKENLQKRLDLVDEVTSILESALANLVHNAKRLGPMRKESENILIRKVHTHFIQKHQRE